jgi:ubiquinone biosynthesis protein Coq4
VLAGWLHGRETPALLGVLWEQLWHEQVGEIRTRLGVSAFRSPHPADLIEQLLAG